MKLDRAPLDRAPLDRDEGITPTPVRYHPPAAFEFGGVLAAGKTICIDGQDFSVLNDGVNAIGDFEGDFPEVARQGVLTWQDGEASRNVAITVTAPGPIDTIPVAPTLTMIYTGSLGPGETLIIDATDLTVKKDDDPALADFSGDFPQVGPGTNTLTYTDSGGSRNVTIKVIRNERSI